MTEAKTVVADPALGFSYQIVLDKDARRTLVFQGHVTVDTPVEKLNEVVDKVAQAADRQIAIYELQQAEEDKAGQLRTMETLERQVATMEEISKARWTASGRKGEWNSERLDAQEKAAHKNIEVSLERYRDGIRRAQATIDRCRPLVNGHAPDIGANHQSG